MGVTGGVDSSVLQTQRPPLDLASSARSSAWAAHSSALAGMTTSGSLGRTIAGAAVVRALARQAQGIEYLAQVAHQDGRRRLEQRKFPLEEGNVEHRIVNDQLAAFDEL